MLLLSRFSCMTVCDPIDSSLPGPSVHGIFQARVLEWFAIAFTSINYNISLTERYHLIYLYIYICHEIYIMMYITPKYYMHDI